MRGEHQLGLVAQHPRGPELVGDVGAELLERRREAAVQPDGAALSQQLAQAFTATHGDGDQAHEDQGYAAELQHGGVLPEQDRAQRDRGDRLDVRIIDVIAAGRRGSETVISSQPSDL